MNLLLLRFYMTPDKRTYYLGEEEEDLHQATFHKSDQTKVMFLAAVARPRRDTGANKNFSGSIGCWPIMEEYIAPVSYTHLTLPTKRIV